MAEKNWIPEKVIAMGMGCVDVAELFSRCRLLHPFG
jgi:hypothetical protein